MERAMTEAAPDGGEEVHFGVASRNIWARTANALRRLGWRLGRLGCAGFFFMGLWCFGFEHFESFVDFEPEAFDFRLAPRGHGRGIQTANGRWKFVEENPIELAEYHVHDALGVAAYFVGVDDATGRGVILALKAAPCFPQNPKALVADGPSQIRRQ
jgi:hypothetical protein